MEKKNQTSIDTPENQIILKQFKRLLEDQSNINLDQLQMIMKDLGEFFDVDRIALFLYEQIASSFQLFVEWCHIGIKPREQHIYEILDVTNDHFFNDLHQGSVHLNDVQNTKLENSWLSYLKKDETKAFYAIPLFNDRDLMGYLSFENQRRVTDFNKVIPHDIVSLVHLIALKFSYMAISNDIKSNQNKHQSDMKEQYTFVSNISHEIKTPLNGVLNALYLMQTTDLSKEQKKYIEMAQSSTDGISSIVDRILDLEALGNSKLDIKERSFNLEDEMIRIYKMHQQAIEQKKLSFVMNFDYRIMHEVIGDDRKVRQILSHLLQNAIKFTDQGTILLDIRHTKDNLYTFQMKDTGIGIPQNQIDKLYEAFYQINMNDDKEFQGMGIGLTVAYELTKLLCGTLSAESKPEHGSTFTLQIPLAKSHVISYKEVENLSVFVYHQNQESPYISLFESMGMQVFDVSSVVGHKVDIILFESPIKQGETINQFKELYGHQDTLMFSLKHIDQKKLKKVDVLLEEPISRNIIMQKIMMTHHEMRKAVTSFYTKQLTGTALIVDDNRLNRVALQSILSKLGIQSKMVESGVLAIEMVKEEKFDLILMDIQMPHMDGIEATRRIRSLGYTYQALPIVAVTANAYFNDYDLLKASQINDVIFKPIKMESLAQILRKYLNHKEVISIPEELPVFDKHDFLKRFEDSYDIAKEVIETFQIEYVKDIEKIRIAIASSNTEEIIKTAHYYKGSCAYLSGKRVVWVINRMMDQAKAQLLEEMDDLYKLLMGESEQLIKALIEMNVFG